VIKDGEESSGSGIEPTKIDLGDDLIEKTAIIPGHSASSVPSDSPPVQSSSELLQNARILLSEGFPEEAKKVLRQLMLALASAPEASADLEQARALLEKIHESELKQMFGTAEPAARRSFTSTYDESILDADSEEIVRLLDRDMGLGGLGGLGAGVSKELSFFSDERLLAQYADQVDRELGEGSASDRTDLAIGFMEMGLYSVAIRLLQSHLVSESEEMRLNASALVGYAHLMNNEPYRTISVLQPVLNDIEIDKSRKTECFYLIARAEQANGNYAGAIGWYFQAQANETDYRDIARRIARCKEALTGK
jgi:hypothetical protein